MECDESLRVSNETLNRARFQLSTHCFAFVLSAEHLLKTIFQLHEKAKRYAYMQIRSRRMSVNTKGLCIKAWLVKII